MEFLRQPVAGTRVDAAVYDAGLRAFMLSVYNYMAIALAISGFVSFGVANIPALMDLFYVVQDGRLAGMRPLGWVAALAPLGFVILFSVKAKSMSPSTAQTMLWAFAALMGLSMASIFYAYTTASITRVFFITAGVFGGMSLYGYTTKRNLTGMGSFLMMGLIGIIIASLVNLFLQSSAVDFAVSLIGVFLFIGLTAYDTQKLKLTYNQVAGDAEMAAKVAVMGALELYLDFINLFMMLLRFFGDRR